MKNKFVTSFYKNPGDLVDNTFLCLVIDEPGMPSIVRKYRTYDKTKESLDSYYDVFSRSEIGIVISYVRRSSFHVTPGIVFVLTNESICWKSCL